MARDSGRRWGVSETSEPSLVAPWMEGDPRAAKPLPAVTLAKICFLWPFPPDGRGMAWGRVHSPPPSTRWVGWGPPASSPPFSSLPLQPPSHSHRGGTGIGDPLAACGGGCPAEIEGKGSWGRGEREFPVLLPAPPPPSTHMNVSQPTSFPPSCRGPFPVPGRARPGSPALPLLEERGLVLLWKGLRSSEAA